MMFIKDQSYLNFLNGPQSSKSKSKSGSKLSKSSASEKLILLLISSASYLFKKGFSKYSSITTKTVPQNINTNSINFSSTISGFCIPSILTYLKHKCFILPLSFHIDLILSTNSLEIFSKSFSSTNHFF